MISEVILFIEDNSSTFKLLRNLKSKIVFEFKILNPIETHCNIVQCFINCLNESSNESSNKLFVLVKNGAEPIFNAEKTFDGELVSHI